MKPKTKLTLTNEEKPDITIQTTFHKQNNYLSYYVFHGNMKNNNGIKIKLIQMSPIIGDPKVSRKCSLKAINTKRKTDTIHNSIKTKRQPSERSQVDATKIPIKLKNKLMAQVIPAIFPSKE
jgi:hypothetical protein